MSHEAADSKENAHRGAAMPRKGELTILLIHKRQDKDVYTNTKIKQTLCQCCKFLSLRWHLLFVVFMLLLMLRENPR